jgi:mannose-6-phosphate isomerase-like protein (cupin superfamily)
VAQRSFCPPAHEGTPIVNVFLQGLGARVRADPLEGLDRGHLRDVIAGPPRPDGRSKPVRPNPEEMGDAGVADFDQGIHSPHGHGGVRVKQSLGDKGQRALRDLGADEADKPQRRLELHRGCPVLDAFQEERDHCFAAHGCQEGKGLGAPLDAGGGLILRRGAAFGHGRREGRDGRHPEEEQRLPGRRPIARILQPADDMGNGPLILEKRKRPHYHKRTTEWVYVVEGHGAISPQYDILDISRGDWIKIEPHTRHTMINFKHEDMVVVCVSSPAFDMDDVYYD